MLVGSESGRRRAADIQRAPRQFVDAVTSATVEMVVVREIGPLVERAQFGMVQPAQDALGYENPEVTVDGGQVQPLNALTAQIEDILG